MFTKSWNSLTINVQVRLWLVVFLVSLVAPACVSSPEQDPTQFTIQATDAGLEQAANTPAVTEKPPILVVQETSLYAGPDNEHFEVLAALPKNTPVEPQGRFGDFIKVTVSDSSDELSGYLWDQLLPPLEDELPILLEQEVPSVEIDLTADFFDPEIRRQGGNVILQTVPDHWRSVDLGPIDVPGPFELEVVRETRGEYGAITVRGNSIPFLTEELEAVASGETYWPIPMLYLTDDYRVDLSNHNFGKDDGPDYSEGVGQLQEPGFILRFHDAEGKRLSLLSRDGEEYFSLDVTEDPLEPLSGGLFPHGYFFPGLMAGPDSRVTLLRMTLRYKPNGRFAMDEAGPSLRQLAEPLDLLIGSGTISYLLTDLENTSILAEEFNYLIVAQFAWHEIQTERGQYRYDKAEAMLAFAESHGMQVQCADLIPPSPGDLPDWVRQGSFSREEWKLILKEHITTVVSDFKGRCHVWSVINEEIARHLSMPGGFWMSRIGPEVFELAFQWAHEADPEAILLLKDTDGYDRDTEWTRRIGDEMYRVSQDLVDKGVPIDGVAFQLHLLLADTSHVPTTQGVVDHMSRFEELGLDIYFDEIDVNLGSVPGSQDERWAFQADVYADVLRACLELERCRSFSVFEYTDRHSWLGDCETCRYVPNSEAHPWDKYYQPKPAYYALREVLMEAQP